MKKYNITQILIGICIVVYLATSFTFSMTMDASQGVLAGGFFPPYVKYFNQYYRLITANFIHFGIIHLLVNCYSLYNIGSFIELVFKKKQCLIIIVFSMISTTLLPYILYLLFGVGGNTVSGGISGIICGLVGSVCYLGLKYRGVYYQVYRKILPSIIFMVFLSVSLAGISLLGHLGGFIGGVIGTYVAIKFKDRKQNLYN